MAALLFSTPSTVSTPARGLLAVVIVLGALSGPHALFLLPVAAGFQLHQNEFRRWLGQWWVRLYALLAVVQAGYIGWSLASGSFQTGVAQGGHRFAGWTLAGVGHSLVKYNLVYPVFGYSLLDQSLTIKVAAIGALVLAWVWLLWKGSSRLRAIVVAGLILQGLYLAASIGGEGGQRYAFTVNVLLMLGVAGEAFWSNSPATVRRVAAVLLVTTMLCSMLDQSARVGKFVHHNWPDWPQAFSQGCADMVDTSKLACIRAWPSDDQRWVYCPSRAQMANACDRP
jgi:hypothetical protein